jgi:uncharacterized protein YcbK (DUF882 family)
MRAVIAGLVCATFLSGCAPFTIFANGSGPAYNSYRQSWGTYVASNSVDAFCITPRLRLAIWEFEGHFGKKIVMNSGYRSPWYNASIGGAENSYHTRCLAADFFIPGVSKSQLIAFARSNPLVGGLGCYPGRNFIHIDVRPRAPGRGGPVTFNGC